MSAPRQLKVGISMFIRGPEQSLWENGIFQNCLFMILLFRLIPSVSDVWLVADGHGTVEDARRMVDDDSLPVIGMQEALERCDVMLEMSAQLSQEWVRKFRARGGKVVTYRVGNDYVIDTERMIHNKQFALLMIGTPYDGIWTIPEYEKTCAQYYGSAMRAPVRIVPHLWSPLVLDRANRTLQAPWHFGYQPGKRRWRAGVFEPNICMVKTSFIPLLACEAAHRENPDMLSHVWAYSTFRLKDHGSFNAFARELDIVKHGLASFEERYPFYAVMAEQVDVVVSHHWENAQNYLYYETLYGAYPLVHNSHLIGSTGYRYHDFDCEEGARALLRAFAEHDANLDSYKLNARAFLRTLYPEYEGNVRAYAEALDALYQAP
jgi:hypothetical protein